MCIYSLSYNQDNYNRDVCYNQDTFFFWTPKGSKSLCTCENNQGVCYNQDTLLMTPILVIACRLYYLNTSKMFLFSSNIVRTANLGITCHPHKEHCEKYLKPAPFYLHPWYTHTRLFLVVRLGGGRDWAA